MTVIAMWSGPRNISTAMMYAFASRPHTLVWDEPFYAHYLHETGITHPMGDAVIAAGDTGYGTVVAKCLAPLPRWRRRVLPEAHDPPHAARTGLALVP
jgi:hypothetical protein